MSAVGPPSDYFRTQYRDYEKQNPPRKLDHYLDVIDSYWSDAPVDLLDVGCGLGAFLQQVHLRHPSWSLYGTDINQLGVESTRARVPMALVSVDSVDRQSHPDRSLDVITAWDVIEHVESLQNVAASICAMLRPGGLFVFVVPVYDGLLGKVVDLLDRDPTHVHKRGRLFWLDWAAESFEVLDWHGIFRYLIAGRWYVHIPSLGLRRQAPALLVGCRKSSRIS